MDLELLGRTLTILDDRQRERARDLDDRLFEMLPQGAIARGIDSGRSVCEQEDGVVRARIAVDGNRVECPIGNPPQKRAQHARLRYGIGCDHAEQRCHVGVDHAGAFSDATNGDRRGSLETNGAVLGSCVGRHDGAGGIDAAVRRQLRRGLAQACADFVDGEGNADHAGREHERRAGRQSGRFFRAARHRPSGLESRCAGAGVGDARVHGDRTDASRPLAQKIGVVDDRCGA